jgi:hypothetical protein
VSKTQRQAGNTWNRLPGHSCWCAAVRERLSGFNLKSPNTSDMTVMLSTRSCKDGLYRGRALGRVRSAWK